MTNEQKVNDIRKQRNFFVKIGGKDLEMTPLTLSMLDDISALSSLLPILEGGDKVKASDIFALPGCGKTLAKIFFLSAEPCIKIDIEPAIPKYRWYHSRRFIERKQREAEQYIERKKEDAFNRIYKEMSFEEMQEALKAIFNNSQLFFYIDCITSLRGINRLKETKETDQIVPGS